MGSTWSRSLSLARQSIEVLRSNPALIAFPIVSGVVSLAVTATFFIPLLLTYWGHMPKQVPVVGYVVMAIYYLVSYFVVNFFNVGLASCVVASMRGERPSFGDGIRYATQRLPAILGWTLLSATVGLVLQLISERVEIVGKIVVAVLGAAWNVVTYLVVPVLAVEGKGPVASLKESTALLKRTWGEQIIGNGGVGLVLTVAALVPFAFLVGSFFTASAYVIVPVAILCVMYWMALAVLGASISGVYRTALYVYATTGNPPSGFLPEDLTSAFKERKIGKVEGFIRGRF